MTELERASDTLLMGTISLDHYLASGDVLPGGGVLNMAWNWQLLGRPFELLTRVGAEDGGPITAFLERHAIPTVSPGEVVAPGRSSAIDIEILPDRQPHMDNFIGGVWDDYALTTRERLSLRAAQRFHTVLVEGAIAELGRLGDAGLLRGIEVSADFLGFRHYTVERLADTMRHVDLGIIGWPGAEDDPTVNGFRRVATEMGKLLVVTMGSRAVRVFDGRAEAMIRDRRYPVGAVPVAGTTLGCGDAFIAWFLDAWWRTRDLDEAVAQGMIGGARTTAWPRPLPDDAYDLQPSHEGAT
ncbi:MAG TPA: carbohydrate kinase family protein [Candidatus Limnocylindrales bacterium]|nr:carbohydrate kinase family protein [Candidatus Limnocylindrales bacterium]